MKKTFTFLLIAALIFTGTVFPLAETEEPQYPSMVELVKQLKVDERVKEIWIPLLPENEPIVTSLTIEDDGSYIFDYKRPKSDEEIAENDIQYILYHIAFVTAQNQHILYSPYQVTQVRKGNPTPLRITEASVNTILPQDVIQEQMVYKILDDRVVYMTLINQPYDENREFGAYRIWPAAAIEWCQAYLLPSEASMDYPFEAAIGLSGKTLASVRYAPFDVPSEKYDTTKWLSYLQKTSGISFTTIGDANADGTVNAIDALAILKHSVGTAPITNELTFLLCDADDNNQLNAEDALFALKRAVGKQAF